MARFITFEGLEGSGKTTHIGKVRARLEEIGYEVVTTREPGGTKIGEAVRGLLQYDSVAETPCPSAELLLFCASRAQLVENVITPALERGAWVLCDRFSDSTYAYQGYGRGFDLETLRSVNEFATGGLEPALTLLLAIDPATSRRRVGERNGEVVPQDRFESEPDEFHRRVEEGFHRLALESPERISVVNSDGSIEDIAVKIWDIVAAKLLTDGE